VPFLAERMGIALEAGPPGTGPSGGFPESAANAAGPDADEPRAATASADEKKADLDAMDDSDVEALLLAKLTEIEGGHVA
jgi:hypothetical protein